MAAKPADPLKKLEEQLTCSVCLDQLANPKTLSCLHSFCYKCLERLTDYNNEVKCPTCRSSHELGEDGVDSLQTAFLVNNLMEVHGMLKKVGSKKMLLCDICGEMFAVGYCQQCESFSCDACLKFHNKWKKNATHRFLTLEELTESAYELPRAKAEKVIKCKGHNKPLDIYCETCDELICQHCTVRIHRGHEYDVVNDVYEEHCQEIEDSVKPIDNLIREAETLKISLNTSKDSLGKKGEKVKEEIQLRVSEVTDSLFTAADKLSHEVDFIVKRQEKEMDEKLNRIDSLMERLSSCKDYVKQSLDLGSPQQVLSNKSKLMDHAQGVFNSCSFSEFQQTSEFRIRLHRGNNLKQSTILNSIGKIRSETLEISTVRNTSYEYWQGNEQPISDEEWTGLVKESSVGNNYLVKSKTGKKLPTPLEPLIMMPDALLSDEHTKDEQEEASALWGSAHVNEDPMDSNCQTVNEGTIENSAEYFSGKHEAVDYDQESTLNQFIGLIQASDMPEVSHFDSCKEAKIPSKSKHSVEDDPVQQWSPQLHSELSSSSDEDGY